MREVAGDKASFHTTASYPSKSHKKNASKYHLGSVFLYENGFVLCYKYLYISHLKVNAPRVALRTEKPNQNQNKATGSISCLAVIIQSPFPQYPLQKHPS